MKRVVGWLSDRQQWRYFARRVDLLRRVRSDFLRNGAAMTDELDTLRPEVREALEVCTRGVDCVSFGDNDAPQIIRAELLRLARENDEWQMRCLQFQTERDHARQMHADRDVDVQHEWARAEAAEAELAALKARMKPCAQVVNGEVRAFMDPDDEGKYVAVVVVED